MSFVLIKSLLLAVGMAICTFYGVGWWLKCEPKISNWWLKIGASFLVVIGFIFGPIILLSANWNGLGEDWKFWLLLIWILPTFLIHGYAAIKKHRKEQAARTKSPRNDPNVPPTDQ